jgi:hypothetical protein
MNQWPGAGGAVAKETLEIEEGPLLIFPSFNFLPGVQVTFVTPSA